MHITDARQRFDGGTDPGVDTEAAGEGELDLVSRQVEYNGDPAAPAGLAPDQALEARQGFKLADEDAQPRGGMGDDAREPLHLLRREAQALLPPPDIPRHHPR